MAQFEQTAEVKVIRDPIHGYIHIHDALIWELLKTKEVQRLRRIKQLGGNFQVWPSAEHSRFTHSAGVYEITRRMCEEVESIRSVLSAEEKIQVMCAALLHDLGHGPLSHFFETVTGIKHEQVTRNLILNQKGEIYPLLEKTRKGLSENVIRILDHTHPNTLLSEMISSQLDADRMDYLLRDAYMTGTSYGTFDLERILRTLRTKDGHLCIKESGMHALEDYIIARYQMYHQVYLHPDAAAYEILVEKLFERNADLPAEMRIPSFAFLQFEFSPETFLDFDDHCLYAGIHEAEKSKDPVLKDLAHRILTRDLYGHLRNPSPEQTAAIRQALQDAGLEEAYYLHFRTDLSSSEKPYEESAAPLKVLKAGGNLENLSSVSFLSASLLQMECRPASVLYTDKTILARLQNTIPGLAASA